MGSTATTTASTGWSPPPTVRRTTTANTTVELIGNQTVTRRAHKPYGEARGPQPSTWPNKRGYLDVGIDDKTTGLTHIGAREYDSQIGRFISIDPIMDLADPLQINGYAYANNTPITVSDPTGLWIDDGTGQSELRKGQKARKDVESPAAVSARAGAMTTAPSASRPASNRESSVEYGTRAVTPARGYTGPSSPTRSRRLRKKPGSTPSETTCRSDTRSRSSSM
ncbi:RHS repeat-associated core domain-containing protein [Streptomyces sp. NPDC002454]